MNEEPPAFKEQPVPEPRTLRVLCRKCGVMLEPSYLFCPRCGTRQAQDTAWYYQPIWVFVLAFAVLGPFALPLVWMSPKMSVGAKIGMTIALLVYTILCLYYAYVMIALILKELSRLDGVMRLR